MVKPTDRRQAVGSIRASYEFSERRACRALGFSRSSHRYASRRKEPAELIERLRAHAASRPRFGPNWCHYARTAGHWPNSLCADDGDLKRHQQT
jgi:putative transposase